MRWENDTTPLRIRSGCYECARHAIYLDLETSPWARALALAHGTGTGTSLCRQV